MSEEGVRDVLGKRPDDFWAQHPDWTGLPFDELTPAFRQLLEAGGPQIFEEAVQYLGDRYRAVLDADRGDSPTYLAYIREVERWNVVGLALLSQEMAPLATVFYSRLLSVIRGHQELHELRLHKGTPYHLLGQAALFQQQREEAHDYFLLAAFEDAQLSDDWRVSPAATMLGTVWNGAVEYARVAGLIERVSQSVRADGRLFLWNPELLLLLTETES